MITYHRDSVEYVTCKVDEASLFNIMELGVEISLSRSGQHTWLPARWIEGRAQTVDPISFDAQQWPESNYTVCVKVIGNPETIISVAGTLTIVC